MDKSGRPTSHPSHVFTILINQSPALVGDFYFSTMPEKQNLPYKPFRLGRKQQRVILDDKGLEVAWFHERSKHLAPKVVDMLNEFITGKKQN